MSIDLNEVSERLLESGHIAAHEHLPGNEEWVIQGLLRVATGERIGRQGKEAARVIAELADWSDAEGLRNLIAATCDALGNDLTGERPSSEAFDFVTEQMARAPEARNVGHQRTITGRVLVGSEDGVVSQVRTYNRHATLLEYLT